MVELEPRYCATLEANTKARRDDALLGNASVYCRDIRGFDGRALPQVQFILGGPPCQTFSAAGRRSHGVMGTDDPRGELFLEYIRLLELLRPRAFLFENVYGITGAQDGRAWQLILESFESAGYSASFRILDAADYGVPQHRERLIVVGMREGTFEFPRPTHGPDSPGLVRHYDAGTAIADMKGQGFEEALTVGGRYGSLLADIPPGLNYSFYTERLGHPRPLFAWRSKFSDFLYKADPEVPVRTIKAHGGQYTGPFHWDGRAFNIDEFKRLQTFPDDFVVTGNRQTAIQQIGNSVPPQFARVLALAILEQVFDVDLPASLPKLRPNEKLSFRRLKRRRTQEYSNKAALALSGLDDGANTNDKPTGRRRYSARLTDAFDFLCERGGSIRVEEWTNRSGWIIRIEDMASDDVADSFRIIVEPSSDGWGIPARTVELRSVRHSLDSFVAAWKAFEARLVRNGLKADLVQLNGYYQYRPALKARLSFEAEEAPTNEWGVIKAVVQGEGVRAPMSVATLAFIWGIPESSVAPTCRLLRSIGYEVRNSNTNPQMPAGNYLIPYAFPTLNSLSVQRRKVL